MTTWHRLKSELVNLSEHLNDISASRSTDSPAKAAVVLGLIEEIQAQLMLLSQDCSESYPSLPDFIGEGILALGGNSPVPTNLTRILVEDGEVGNNCSQPLLVMLSNLVSGFRVQQEIIAYLSKLSYSLLRVSKKRGVRLRAIKLFTIVCRQDRDPLSINESMNKLMESLFVIGMNDFKLRSGALECIRCVTEDNGYHFSNQVIQGLNRFLIACCSIAMSKKSPPMLGRQTIEAGINFISTFPQFDESSVIHEKIQGLTQSFQY
jgi:hypothetical protein